VDECGAQTDARLHRCPGYLRVMFTVEDIDKTLAWLRKRGAQLVGRWRADPLACR
jgi:hypothetical protein